MADELTQDFPECPRCGGMLDEDGETCAACEAEGGAPVALPVALPPVPAPAPATRQARAEPPPPRSATGGDAPPPPQAGGDDASDETFIRKMRNVRTSGLPSVVFIGFAAAGKTWMVHRFLEGVSKRTDCPPFTKVNDRTEPNGRDLGASTAFTVYDVQDRKRPYHLIDTPGEETRLLMRLGDEQTTEAWKEAWKIVAALKQASAVVIALPADVMFFGPAIGTLVNERKLKTDPGARAFAKEALGNPPKVTREQTQQVKKWAEDLLDNNGDMETFVSGIINAVALLSYVQDKDIDPLDQNEFKAKVSREAVLQHRQEKREFEGWNAKDGLACPTFFALTKADLVVSSMLGAEALQNSPDLARRCKEMEQRIDVRAMRELARIEGMLDNRDRFPFAVPSDFVRAVNEGLHNRLIETFQLARFDFVTAFFGHDGSTRVTSSHYTRFPEQGVREMREWINQARRMRSKRYARWRHRVARELHLALHGIDREDMAIGD